MAYLSEIEKYTCICGEKATHYLFNRFNARLGAWCLKHGNEEVKKHNARDN